MKSDTVWLASLPLMDDYLSGRRAFTLFNILCDVKLIGGISGEQVKLITENIQCYARGDESLALGRALKFRDTTIRHKLN